MRSTPPGRGLASRRSRPIQSADNPNEVTAWHDFESLDAAKAFAASDELKGAMGAAGVSNEPAIWFAREA